MAARKRRNYPKWWQGLIMMVSGVVLGFSSCAAALNGASFSGYGGNRGSQEIFVIGFFAGVVLLLSGFVVFVIGVALAIVNSLSTPSPTLGLTPAVQAVGAPGTAGLPVAAVPLHDETPEQRVLRQFQIALVVFMLLPAASVATSVLALLARPNLAPIFAVIIVSYALSQAPYGFALVRTRRQPDRLGIAIAFAAACTATVEGLLPFTHGAGMFAIRTGLFAWPAIFLLSHVVVAIFAWRAGKLAPPEGDDLALLAASFVGVVAYLLVVHYVEASLLPLYMRGVRYH
jgi:hypothetical protein